MRVFSHDRVLSHALRPASNAPAAAGLPRGGVEAARTPGPLDVVLVVPRVAVPVPPRTGAPAPAAVAPPSPASASSPDAPARAAAVVLAAGVGRGPHEGEVDLDGLVEQLGLVGAVDGGAGLGERGVFDQRVALLVRAKKGC